MPTNSDRDKPIRIREPATERRNAGSTMRARGKVHHVRALADVPHVDNLHAQPVESLCIGQVIAMHSAM
ncbi:hypothetical protein WL34_19375 [Burkholderia cepacia]|nr:hypothetical protein WL34_19375 [Burkholderia cepacia]